MPRVGFVLSLLLALSLPVAAQITKRIIEVDKSPHKEGFVSASGIKLHYLDWAAATRAAAVRL